MTKLCPRGKAAAKRKFSVYPSAYANAYASKVCAGKIKDDKGTKRKDFKGPKPSGGGGTGAAARRIRKASSGGDIKIKKIDPLATRLDKAGLRGGIGRALKKPTKQDLDRAAGKIIKAANKAEKKRFRRDVKSLDKMRRFRKRYEARTGKKADMFTNPDFERALFERATKALESQRKSQVRRGLIKEGDAPISEKKGGIIKKNKIKKAGLGLMMLAGKKNRRKVRDKMKDNNLQFVSPGLYAMSSLSEGGTPESTGSYLQQDIDGESFTNPSAQDYYKGMID